MALFGPSSARRTARHARTSQADDVDFEIFGEDLQYVEIELDPGESALAEAGSMMMKHADVEMETIFGDGSDDGAGAGFLTRLTDAGKRLLVGESLFMTTFTHRGDGKARVAFSAAYPGKIFPVKLDDVGGTLLCQNRCFLAAARGVKLDMQFQRKIFTGLFGGEGFVMQRFEGDGWVFAHAGGAIAERRLDHDEVLHVDTGSIAAMTADIDFEVERAGSVKSMLFGGEGLFFARLRGPGTVWVQSLPISRLAASLAAETAPSASEHAGAHAAASGVKAIFGSVR